MNIVGCLDRPTMFMTQENAGLVGDSAASANLLAQQAQLLGDALSIFQLGDRGAKPERAVRKGRRERAASGSTDVHASGHAADDSAPLPKTGTNGA